MLTKSHLITKLILLGITVLLLQTNLTYSQESQKVIVKNLINEAKALNLKAQEEGARWIISLRHLDDAIEMLKADDLDKAKYHAEQAIHFFNLSLKQKSSEPYRHP